METVIQEIANQLGMAVDQAGQFITEQLPNYAALKVIQISTPLIILAIITGISLVGFIVSFAITKDIDSDIVCVFGFPLLIAGVIFIIGLLAYLSEIIGWMNYPEAMLIDMAIKAVG